jgi:DNA replication protein DnaC
VNNVSVNYTWTVLTSNKPFEEWGDFRGDEVVAAALIDRLLHCCHFVQTRGTSYCIRERRAIGTRKPIALPPPTSRRTRRED